MPEETNDKHGAKKTRVYSTTTPSKFGPLERALEVCCQENPEPEFIALIFGSKLYGHLGLHTDISLFLQLQGG